MLPLDLRHGDTRCGIAWYLSFGPIPAHASDERGASGVRSLTSSTGLQIPWPAKRRS